MKRTIVLVLSGVILTSASLISGATEFDMDLMQTVDDTAKNMVSNLSIGDGNAASVDIADLDGLLAQVADHYQSKGDAEDAVRIAMEARRQLIDIARLVEANDFDAANAKSSEFSRSCKACHKIYKK